MILDNTTLAEPQDYKRFCAICFSKGYGRPEQYKIQQKFVKKYKAWSWGGLYKSQVEDAIKYVKVLKPKNGIRNKQ